ncbi:hypothetical protein ABK040_001602 [Willaertia magna]
MLKGFLSRNLTFHKKLVIGNYANNNILHLNKYYYSKKLFKTEENDNDDDNYFKQLQNDIASDNEHVALRSLSHKINIIQNISNISQQDNNNLNSFIDNTLNSSTAPIIPNDNNNDIELIINKEEQEHSPFMEQILSKLSNNNELIVEDESLPTIRKKTMNYIFKAHFRKENNLTFEFNDMDDKLTKFVIDQDELVPSTIKKHLSFIEVDNTELNDEEEMNVLINGYSTWMNPDHKQRNLISPIGDISHLKTIKKKKEEKLINKENLDLKLGFLSEEDVISNPINSFDGIQLQKDLIDSEEDVGFGIASLTFTGEPLSDIDKYSFQVEDIEDLDQFDIDYIEKVSLLEEDAKSKEEDRRLLNNSGDDFNNQLEEEQDTDVVLKEMTFSKTKDGIMMPEYALEEKNQQRVLSNNKPLKKNKEKIDEEELTIRQKLNGTNPLDYQLLQENYKEFLNSLKKQK